jgi:hypothetical protein
MEFSFENPPILLMNPKFFLKSALRKKKYGCRGTTMKDSVSHTQAMKEVSIARGEGESPHRE